MIAHNGHSMFRLEDLLRNLELSKGGFYHHFNSVDSLIEALIYEDLETDLHFLDTCCEIKPASQALRTLLYEASIYENAQQGILPYLETYLYASS